MTTPRSSSAIDISASRNLLWTVLVELVGIEPTTYGLQSRHALQLSYSPCLEQPLIGVGLVGFEPTTPPYQDGALYQLSYRPSSRLFSPEQPIGCGCQPSWPDLLKGGDQPHLPIRLPCYDFTQSSESHRGESALPRLSYLLLGGTHSHGVTGGVYRPGTYSPQHADLRLLAIPTAVVGVADYDPDYDRL